MILSARLLLLFSLLPLSVLAQAPGVPKISNALLEDTLIHSGTAGQFEAAQHDYCAAVVKGGAPACLVFSTATFGESNRYFTLLPFASFIHYDQGKYTDKGLTPEEAKALNARRTPPVASNHESAITLHVDLSILPTVSNADYPLNYFTEYWVKHGSLDIFLRFVKRSLLPAAREAKLMEFEIFTTSLGESPDRVIIVTRLPNFAALDNPKSAFPPARDVDDFQNRNMIDRVETYVMRYRADISSDPRMRVP